MITVLYISTDSIITGASASLLNLIKTVQPEVIPIVLLPEDGPVSQELGERGIQSLTHSFYCFGGQRKKLKTALHHPTRTQLFHYLYDDWKCVRYVNKVLKNKRIDIVHSNTTLTTIGVDLAKHLKAKHVWHVREYLPALVADIYGGTDRLTKLIGSVDATIFISSALKQKWSIDCKQPFVLHDAVRSEKELANIKEKQKYLLFCSAVIYPLKNPEMAIKAFHSSDISDLGYRLKMIGLCNEKYKHELYALMHSLGIENFVDWVEYTDDVKPYFENATAFLMCSDFEGMGRVTAEAMFYGCPIIARATGGTMDLIKHGETGWLFETVEECADLIKKVITDDNEAMVQRAHDFAKHELAEEVYGKKIMDVYNSIL